MTSSDRHLVALRAVTHVSVVFWPCMPLTLIAKPFSGASIYTTTVLNFQHRMLGSEVL